MFEAPTLGVEREQKRQILDLAETDIHTQEKTPSQKVRQRGQREQWGEGQRCFPYKPNSLSPISGTHGGWKDLTLEGSCFLPSG